MTNKRSKSKKPHKNKAALSSSKSSPEPKKAQSKGVKKSFLDKIRRVQPQYFRWFSALLLLAITCLFLLIIKFENEGVMSLAVHYGYVVSIILSLSVPLLGMMVVKRYR